MKVAVVGGGITGLTAGYQLTKIGHQVTIFEKEDYLGGLAAGFQEKNWQWGLENFFHHLFTSDLEAANLIRQLGLGQKLFYVPAKTSIFKEGKIFQFDSATAVLQFPFLSLPERLRVGLATFYLKTATNWLPWEKVSAQSWLQKRYGPKPFALLWHPLLKGKFGFFSDQISMAWFWARLKKRSAQLGYVEGGFQVLIDRLVEEIRNKNGEIMTKKAVKKIIFHNSYSGGIPHSGQFIISNSKFDKVIFTMPTPELRKIKSLPQDYRRRLSRLQFVSALNLVLSLKEKFLIDGTYWLNIVEENFPFVAVVEHTNLVDKKYYGGQHLLYVGGYYPSDHRYLKMKKEEIFKEFLPYLKKINPDFHQSLIIKHQLFKSLSAQPIIPLRYSEIMPSMATPLKNVYLANQSLIYPWDRGMNYAIKLGKEVACLI